MEIQSRKCDDKSKQYLTEGDDFASKSQNYDAIVSYNKSLCFATTKSSNVSLAFANRAAVYLKSKEHQKCLEDIQIARKHKCPPSKCFELDEMEEKCKELSAQKHESLDDDDPFDFFKLSYPPHKKIPFIVDCLKLHESWKYGRGVITTKKLNPGDVVAIEEPLFRMLNKRSRHSRCAGCMKSSKMSLIPCPGKCTSTMFCSQSCLASAMQNFHKFECGALDESLDNDNEYDMTILKMIFESLKFCGSLEKLKALLADSKPVTVFDLDLSNQKDEKQYEKNLLKAIYSLKKGPTSDEDSVMADWMLDSHPVLMSLCKSKSDKDFIRNFTIKLMGIVDRNSYIFYCPSTRTPYVNDEIGTGVFPFASLINHSCSPNLYRTFVDNMQIFIAKKPIDAGQQLFVGYHANFTFATKKLRQEFLLKEFQFKCGCEACAGDFPLMAELKTCDVNFEAPPENVESVEDAKEIFNANCQYIDKNIKILPFPCFEICAVMQNSFRQLQFIASKSFLLNS